MQNFATKRQSKIKPKADCSIFDEISPSFSVHPSVVYNQTDEGTNQTGSLKTFLICKNLCCDEKMEGFFVLKQAYMFYYETNTSTLPKAAFDLSYATLYINVRSQEDSKHRIVMTKNKASYELTFMTKRDFKTWMHQLKKFCILTDFEQKYEIVEISEKQKYSNVCLIESKMGGTHFTAREFNKSDLQQFQNKISESSLVNKIKAMRALNYHRILKLNEVYETEKSIYLVTDFIHDKTLEKLFKKSKWQTSVPKPETKNIMFSLLKTLAYIASKGVIHRNIKPASILMEDSTDIKIINFNLAIFVDSSNENFRTCGTPGYIAPEIFLAEKTTGKYNNKCDVFSAGCIFFQMLFGYPLFYGSDVSEILANNKKHINCNINEVIQSELKKVKTNINQQCLNLLLKLLESDPKKRISAEQALLDPYFESFYGFDKKISNTEELHNIVDKNHLEKLMFLTPRSESRRSIVSTSECSSSRDRSLEKVDFSSLNIETAPDISSLRPHSRISIQTSKTLDKNQLYTPSPKLERPSQSFLKAAIFCSMKNQGKNANEIGIKIPNFGKLNKRSCSDSLIPKVLPEFEVDDNDDADFDDICEGLDEIHTNYQSLTNSLTKRCLTSR